MGFETKKSELLRLYKINVKNGDLKEYLQLLSDEAFNKLYDFYNILHETHKSKKDKTDYLLREIPSQFMDDYYNMMDNDDHQVIMEIYHGLDVEIDDFILHCLYFGYVFVNKDNKIIMPKENYLRELLCLFKNDKIIKHI